MTTIDFRYRSETFALERTDSWALPALRLIFAVPRTFEPLVDAWERHHPGTRRALNRLTKMGYAAFQPAVVLDTRTGDWADQETRVVPRYRATRKGQRLMTAWREDSRALEEIFPKTTPQNLAGVTRLLDALSLDKGPATFGLSASHATAIAGLADRSGRWWLRRLVAAGYVTELDEKYADVRAVVPAHWRPNRALASQVRDVLANVEGVAQSLAVEFRLHRSTYLEDIDPARLSITGATDFDHDVETQRVVAALLRSPACVTESAVSIEPRFALSADKSFTPWRFGDSGDGDVIIYQPDAELLERVDARTRRCVVEFERFQTRRDGWSHIERFCGWLATSTLPFENAVLRFVVDGDAKVRSYVNLIEAFADHLLDNLDAAPVNHTILAVADSGVLARADDPLADANWFRIELPKGTGTACALHPTTKAWRGRTPYDAYFGAGEELEPEDNTDSEIVSGADLTKMFGSGDSW